jgi:CRISPR-associated endonuclease Csn1
MSELIFGLDLGTTSCGWAVRRGRAVADAGVRIFPETLDEKSLEPLNKKRREARLIRRQTRRRRARRKRLTELLCASGLLPPYGSAEWAALMTNTDPYALRAKGLDCRLEAHDLGRALYHLEKRRGFRGRSAAERDDDKPGEADREEGQVKSAIEALKAEMGEGKTLGAHLAALKTPEGDSRPAPERVTGRWLGRDMIASEFEALIEAQKAHHPILKDETFLDDLREMIFFQRPTFWRERTLGRCSLLPEEPLALKADWLAQHSAVLQAVNALRFQAGNQRPLNDEERAAVLSLAAQQPKVTFGAIRRALKPIWKRSGVDPNSRFTHEREGGAKDIPGNATEAALRKALGADVLSALPGRDRLRAELPQRLWEADFLARGKPGNRRFEIRSPEAREAARAALAQDLSAEFALSAVQARALAELKLPSGWSRHSRSALAALQSHLEAGLPYMQARLAVFPEADRGAGAGLDRLPSAPRHLPDIRNPAVIRALNEMRKVVNNLIAVYGKPSRIRLELARDLQLPPAKRREVIAINKKNQTARKKAAQALEARGVPASRGNIEKWLLWQESDEKCPYSGDTVGFADLFDETKVDVEHIIPRSRSNDNRAANKTICVSHVNKDKGNRTPFEYFGPGETWETFKTRVWNLRAMPTTKKIRLTKEIDGPLRDKAGKPLDDGTAMTEDGAERALRDSSYIARAARGFLEALYPHVNGQASPVETVSGRVTAQLRRRWGLTDLLPDETAPDDGAGGKNRKDHRHHAVDAIVVSFAEVKHTQQLSRWFAREKDEGRRPPPLTLPVSDLRQQAERALGTMLVSHRVRRKISGPLHEETVLRDTGMTRKGTAGKPLTAYVTRKPVAGLTAAQLKDVRDSGIRAILQARLEAFGGNVKAAFGNPDDPPTLPTPSGPRPIKRVRVLVEQDPDLMVPLNARTKSFARTGDNHHMAIFHRPDGKVDYETVSRAEANRRHRAGDPVIRRTRGDGAEFLMSLCLGDTLAFPRPDGGADYRVVASLWAGGQIVLCDHTAADGAVWSRPGPAAIVKAGAYKVAVDPIGRPRPARD